MSSLDASFLYAEDGTTHMAIASCAIFEGPTPAYADLVALFAAKLPLVPRYRQRVRFVPLDLGRPVWVDDPAFDISFHVRHTALPAPGDEAALNRLFGRLMSQELDRSRPLWETWLVDGLDGGRWAIISKVHHCMVDGVAGVDLISVVLDASAEPVSTAPDAWDPEPQPSHLRLTVDALAEMAKGPGDGLRGALAAASHPGATYRRVGAVAAGLRSFAAALQPTPPTSLDGSIGANRRWTCARASLDEVRTIRRALGGTVNDVVLAAVTSGLRDLVVARGEDPSTVALRTLVPVSVRAPSAHGIPDNRVSAILFDLPVHVADPLERLEAVRLEMDRLKTSHEPEAGEVLTAFVGALPSPVTAATTRLATRLLGRFHQRSLNTVTTNVPGPPMPLYAVGRRMLEYLPYVPLGPGIRIGVAILSYDGHLAFGVTGDYDTAADISIVAAGIETEIARLVHLAVAARTAA
jgi:WS/DGAT/MGAT family acyltransferase